MELGKYFITNKPRETAGSSTADKYTYQQEWALNKIIDLFEQNKDFALIMEYHEDVVIFDNCTVPKHLDMFQIKTNEKTNQSFITPAILLKKEKDKSSNPPKLSPSFLEKLFYNFSLFNEYEKKIYFVSNKPFKFEKSKIDSEKQNPIFLSNLLQADFGNLTSQICKVCGKTTCKQECKNCVVFEKSSLNVQTSYDQLFIKLQTFISKYANVTYSDSKAIYNTLMSQVRTINDSKEKFLCDNFNILVQKYTISKESLKNFLNNIAYEQSFTNKWSEIHTTLLSEGYKPKEIKKIKSDCQEYILETFNDYEGHLNTLVDLIDQQIKLVDDTTLRGTLHSIFNRIKCSNAYEPIIYRDDFYLGAIIMRWFNE